MLILFLGGDIRQEYASEYLRQHGIPSEVFIDFILNEKIKYYISKSDCIVLPLPVLKEGKYLNMKGDIRIPLKNLFEAIGFDKIILAGMLPDSLEEYSDYDNHKKIDYYNDERFKIYNAYLSAEGAVFYAKKRMDKSIHSSQIAIMGYGRIGKILSHILRAQGAKIYIFTRKQLDMVWSELSGFQSQEIKNMGTIDDIKNMDVIFNTIPSHIFNEDIVQNISDHTLIIDIASYPYGIDEKLLERYPLKYFKEAGIPGRYAPQSAGEALGKTIINLLERRY